MSLLQAINLPTPPRDRRSASRTSANVQVVLQWDGPESRVGVATVLDGSVSGLRIRHRLPLRRKDTVTIIAPTWIRSARVAWLAELDGGAQEAGLMFEPRSLFSGTSRD